jgi:hypothetical protein
MTAWLNAMLDSEGRRPVSATAAATLSVFVGGATLIGATIVVVAVLTWGEAPWGPAIVALVQVSAGVLLIVGGARLATGAGRGVLFWGIALELVTCAIHGWYAVTAVAADRDDAALVPVLLTIAGTFAVVTVVVLWLALRPAVVWHVS